MYTYLHTLYKDIRVSQPIEQCQRSKDGTIDGKIGPMDTQKPFTDPQKRIFFLSCRTKSNQQFTQLIFFLCLFLMYDSFSPCPSDFQKLPLDKRVSQALNGDLYFSNVLPDDSRPDYICYARFPHTQTIQQKQPISVTVLDSKLRH